MAAELTLHDLLACFDRETGALTAVDDELRGLAAVVERIADWLDTREVPAVVLDGVENYKIVRAADELRRIVREAR